MTLKEHAYGVVWQGVHHEVVDLDDAEREMREVTACLERDNSIANGRIQELENKLTEKSEQLMGTLTDLGVMRHAADSWEKQYNELVKRKNMLFDEKQLLIAKIGVAKEILVGLCSGYYHCHCGSYDDMKDVLETPP